MRIRIETEGVAKRRAVEPHRAPPPPFGGPPPPEGEESYSPFPIRTNGTRYPVEVTASNGSMSW
jgi:hypothetical protein